MAETLPNMILTPDSSAQDTLATSPELLIPSVSSHDSRVSNVPRVPSQGMSSPYHVMQLADHRLSPSMPTMDSTVSSAKPEPELNIGTRISFFFTTERSRLIQFTISDWHASVKRMESQCRDSGWKQKVVMRRDAVTRYTRERRKCSSFPPTFLSRSARGEEAAAEDIVTTCINGMRFSRLFQNSTGPLCCAGSAVIRHPVFIMEFTPARAARWVPADQLSITQRFDSFGFRLFAVLRYNSLFKFLNRRRWRNLISYERSEMPCIFAPSDFDM